MVEELHIVGDSGKLFLWDSFERIVFFFFVRGQTASSASRGVDDELVALTLSTLFFFSVV